MNAQKQHSKRAKALFCAGRFPEAEAIYLRVLDRNPADADSLQFLGLIHADTGRLETGAQLLRAAIGIDGPRPWLCRNLGIISERRGDRAAAAACYRQALVESPDDHELWAALATLLTGSATPSETASAWKHAVESAPSGSEAECRYRLSLANALALAGDRRAALTHYDAVLRRDPSLVEAVFHRAVAYMQENDADTAIDGFRRTLALDPRHARAANNLGILYQLTKDYPKAIEHYRIAIREDPAYHPALHNLGSAWQESGRPGHAIAVFRKVLQMQPNSAAAWTNLGNAWLARNYTDAASECYRKTLAVAPGDAAAEWNLGIVALLTGDLRTGWAGYERRFDVNGATPRRLFPAPLWRGEPLAGKTLFLHAEQGLGDTLQFIRYAPVFAAQGARVVVECQPSLLPLLTRLEGVAEWIPAPAGRIPAADFQLSLLSAPGPAGTTLANIPFPDSYLQAPDEATTRWRDWLGTPNGRLRAGICWAGNPNHKNDRNRSVPPALLSALEGVAGVEWINLQKGHPAPETLPMRDAARELRDFADTAGLIENLDLVISVDTSVAHLAGALGKPVWVLLPFAPDWRWLLDRSDSPWYAGARLFRQAEAGKWPPVLRRLAREVTELAARRGSADDAILKP